MAYAGETRIVTTAELLRGRQLALVIQASLAEHRRGLDPARTWRLFAEMTITDLAIVEGARNYRSRFQSCATR